MTMSDMTSICFDRIIKEKNLTVYFQPIVDNHQAEIFAYEALIRGPINSLFHSPMDLFHEANKNGRLVELELLCRTLSIEAFQRLKLPGKLFLNASPETLFQADFRAGETLKMLKKANLPAERVVIELTEQSPLEHYQMVRDALKHYKEMGFEIAMDDLGSGYSGLRMWNELRPDYVKIDRYFMTGIGTDKVKQQFVLAIKNIANELNCKVIAEGVETESEFKFIESIGLPFCQGFYIARPVALPLKKVSQHFFISMTKNKTLNVDTNIPLVAGLLQSIPAINAFTTVDQCAKLFNQHPEWESIAVVEEISAGKLKPLGLMGRHCLTSLLVSQDGCERLEQKNIRSLMDKNVWILESQLAIEQVSHALNKQSATQKSLEFIITKQGYYAGIGSIMGLIKALANWQETRACYANPLTLLPDNVAINKKLAQLITVQSKFVIVYIDLDNFNPYNNYYGDEKGNQIISGVADILRGLFSNSLDFIGHVGGDNFIIITQSVHWKTICEQLLSCFSEWVRHRYFPEDQVMGGISALDRFGQKQFYGMLSLSIGCVLYPSFNCKSIHDIAILASHAKSMANKGRGNTLYIANEESHLVQIKQPVTEGYWLSS